MNLNAQANKPNSILKDGEWYKISVPADGVYKIDYNFINDELKVSPTGVSFSNFGVFGQAMGILPEYNGASRIDDLEEIGIKIKAIGVYLRTLRAIINRAIDEGILLHTKYPFRKFSIKKEKTEKRALEKIAQARFAGEAEEKHRDRNQTQRVRNQVMHLVPYQHGGQAQPGNHQ